MEKYSWIKFVFDFELVSGDSISFDFTDGTSPKPIIETWADVRFEGNKVAVATPTTNPGEGTAINFVDAFNADYNVTNTFIVERSVNEVTIYSTIYDFSFDNEVAPNSVTVTRGSGGSAPFEITNVAITAGSTCEKVTVTVTTSETADEILSPIQQSPVSNPIVFEYDRMLTFELNIRKGAINKYQIVTTPAKIYPSGINFEINDNPAGSSVKIIVGGYGLTFTYSLDGTTYTASNVFTNLIGGQYTAYVKDQFGCVTQKDFELDGFGINTPFFYLPTANSIRFKNSVVWGDCANYKNDSNTLSCEVDVPKPWREIQMFQGCDKIVTQFKSNYATNKMTVRNFTNNIINEIPVVKKTNNMRRTDRRDAILFNPELGGTKAGIYFEAGNIYDYDLGTITGDYTLYGALPVWGKAGNFVQLPNGNWYLIEDIGYSDERGAEYLIIDMGLLVLFDTNTIVGSYYNLQNYEVYEAEIDFFTFIDYMVQVTIRATDPYFPEVTYLSEIISVKVRHENSIEIKYWSEENTDMFFGTGIVNKMRMSLEKSYGQPSGSIETYDTDTDTILLNADIRQTDVFVFSPMTKAMMWKIDEALSYKYVTLDGVPYSDKQIEVSEVLGETNLYDVTVTMKKAQVVSRGSGLDFDDSAVEIPALIPTGTGYVKYQ